MRRQLVLLFLLGCVNESDIDLDEAEQAGVSLNGVSLNGVSLNGVSLNGVSLNGVSLDGTTITAGSSQPLTGSEIVGTRWSGVTPDGGRVALRIDDAQQGTGANRDLWFYGISYQRSDETWMSICGEAKALGIAGTWDHTATYRPSPAQFTLACRGTSVAKCVEMGYKAHRGLTVQLASCVRLLRGDYCGTGVPYTATGTTLNLYDNVGVQADTESWIPEAEWSPEGARCVTTLVKTRFLERRQTLPSCVLDLVSVGCGRFRPDTYLIDELPPL